MGGRTGFLVPHRPAMKHLPQEIIKGFDFSILKTVSGKKDWHKIYNEPTIGLSFYHSNLGNSRVLGNATGITSLIEFPFINKQHFIFGLNLKLGLGYINKPFDLIINPDNIAISSHWNCLALAGLHVQYKWDKFFIGSHFELTHLSNAALVAPNLGVNMIQSSIHLGYSFSKNKLRLNLTKNEDQVSEKNKNDYVYFLGFLGRKQIFNHLGENYKVHGGTIAYQHIFSLPLGMEVGLDLMNNSSDVQLLYDKDLIVSNVLKSGAYVGYVLTLEKLHFLVAMGYYVYDKYNLNDKLYHRVGIRYTFLNRFVLNCTLKTHWGNADYLELGFGMRFGK